MAGIASRLSLHGAAFEAAQSIGPQHGRKRRPNGLQSRGDRKPEFGRPSTSTGWGAQ